MKLNDRYDELLFFLGFVTRQHEGVLGDALEYLNRPRNEPPARQEVFLHAPFNSDLKGVIRTYHIYRNGKKPQLYRHIADILSEYLVLFSDFDGDCCGGGRSLYCLGDEGVQLKCEFCGQYFNLLGEQVAGNGDDMTASTFIQMFGMETFENWPYREKLAAMLN